MTDSDISGLLEGGIARSERLRARVLLLVSLLLGSAIILVMLTPGATHHSLGDAAGPAMMRLAAIFFAWSAYQAVVFLGLRNHAPGAQRSTRTWRRLNSVVDPLIPTLMIWDWSAVAGPVQTLGGVLPWLYFPFIAVTALSLSPGTCWLAGITSAACFGGAAGIIARDTTVGHHAPLLVSTTSLGLKALMILVCGGVAAFVAGQLRLNLTNAIRASQERDRAVGIFGQHVSPQVAKRLIDQPTSFHAEVRHVCVMFLDIRGFSSISAQRSPAEVMDYLNTLFAPMISIVNEHGGIVNKFLGDGFMAIFGAPFEDPELHRHAVRCSFALLECVTTLNATATIPATRIGIGIHAGDAMAGTVGSDERREYTLLGDTVNAAARIEQETKARGACIIISDAVLDGIEGESRDVKDLGEVQLRGLGKSLRLHQLA